MTPSATCEIAGRCLCGAVTFAGRVMRDLQACHCTQCRRWSGHVWAGVTSDRLDVAGPVTWFRSSAAAERGFCPTCGSSLFWRRIGGPIEIAAGAIDAPSGLRLTGHIHTADKGDYYAIDDGLPRA